MWFFIILLLLSAFLEGSVTTLPLPLLLFLTAAVVVRKTWIFPAAFLTGFLLDIFLLNPLGKTSLFFVIFLFIILLYDRKFDIQTFHFVFLAAFIGSLIYFIAILHISNILTQALISAIITTLSFWALAKLNKIDTKRKVGFNES